MKLAVAAALTFLTAPAFAQMPPPLTLLGNWPPVEIPHRCVSPNYCVQTFAKCESHTDKVEGLISVPENQMGCVQAGIVVPPRTYTLDEIRRMRDDLYRTEFVIEYCTGQSGCYRKAIWPGDDPKFDQMIEDHLRTYLQFGVPPEALETKSQGTKP